MVPLLDRLEAPILWAEGDGMRRETTLGILSVIGIWLTAGIGLPLVNVLSMFTPEQLLVVRGFLTAAVVFVLLKGRVRAHDRYTYLIAPCVACAALGLFKAVRIWGAHPAMIIITTTPLVNFFITWRSGRRVPVAVAVGLVLLVAGVTIARYESSFNPQGFAWICFATVCNGLLYELFTRATATPYYRCFWGSIGIGTVGLCGSVHASWAPLTSDPSLRLALMGFAVIHGFLYWVSNLYAFEYLPKDVASVLAQGETPAVIVLATILLGETLTGIQWIGVIIALTGAWYVMHWIDAEIT